MDASQLPTHPPEPNRPRLYSHLTGKRFLHLEDSLTLASPKVRIFAGDYSKGRGMQASAFHFLDLDDARWIFADLSWGKPVEFLDYKGGQAADKSRMLSRVLKINCKDDKVWFQLQNGTGEKIGAGAVKPSGALDVEIVVPFAVQDARKMAFAALAYFQAWDIARMLKRVETRD